MMQPYIRQRQSLDESGEVFPIEYEGLNAIVQGTGKTSSGYTGYNSGQTCSKEMKSYWSRCREGLPR